MAATGHRRKVDDLGRVVIPASIRKALDVQEGDVLDVTTDHGRIVMSKPADRCTFCGADDEVEPFKGQVVCWSCTAALRALDRERTGDPPPFAF